MKVHLIKKQTIKNFIIHNAQSISGFDNWLGIIRYADWNKPTDILKTFSTADILGNKSNRVVFNVGGNKYRMICSYYFGRQRAHLFINWIGTHADYNELCGKNDQFTINNY